MTFTGWILSREMRRFSLDQAILPQNGLLLHEAHGACEKSLCGKTTGYIRPANGKNLAIPKTRRWSVTSNLTRR
jgi:hypothetical protein